MSYSPGDLIRFTEDARLERVMNPGTRDAYLARRATHVKAGAVAVIREVTDAGTTTCSLGTAPTGNVYVFPRLSVERLDPESRPEDEADLRYNPVPVTRDELARNLPLGRGFSDATAVIRGLVVRVWYDAGDPLDPNGSISGHKWSINGEGPEVWYSSLNLVFDYLTDHWAAIYAEQTAGALADGDSAEDLRAALDRAVERLQAAEYQRDELRKAADRLETDYRALVIERDRINRDADRHARRAEVAEEERDQNNRYYQAELDRAEGLLGELAKAQAERDALKAKLGWAQDALSEVWTALRGLR